MHCSKFYVINSKRQYSVQHFTISVRDKNLRVLGISIQTAKKILKGVLTPLHGIESAT